MDASYKAVLTAAVVAVVLMAARLFGRRFAGALAGLPLVTAPALLWLAHEQGAGFAAHSALGSLAACAAAPLFAIAYAILARRRGAAVCLAGAALFAAPATLALKVLERWPGLGLLLALATASTVLCLMRAAAARSSAPVAIGAIRGELWLSACLAGVVTAVVAAAAQQVGAFWSGVLCTLPLISAVAMVHLQRAGCVAALPAFVSGYSLGILGKAVFAFVFALTLPRLAALPALLLAAAAGALAIAAIDAWLRQRPVPGLRGAS